MGHVGIQRVSFCGTGTIGPVTGFPTRISQNALIGIGLLAGGVFFARSEGAELTMTAAGGIALATAHTLNWRRLGHRHKRLGICSVEASMFQRRLFILAGAISLFLSACAGLPRERARDLAVASWNLEHLAEQDGVGCRPRGEDAYAALRRYAERLDADVIAFQEVENAAAAARVFPPDRYVVVMSKRPDSARGGDCRGAPGQQIRKQDVGFAVRKGLTVRRNRDVKAIGMGDPDLRWGVDITIMGRRPLRLLNVHLKSGCSAGASAEACATLLRQSPVVERWIDQRTRSGEAAIILGDFNRRLALSGDLIWQDWDDSWPRGSALSLAGQGLNASCDPRYRDFIDHLVLNRLASLRLRPGSFRESPYDPGDDPRPSDHCPVSVRLKAF